MISAGLVLGPWLAFSAPFLGSAGECLAIGQTAFGRELRAVPGWLPVCVEIGVRAQDVGIPPLVAQVVAYRETRFRPDLVGQGGELGVLQVKPRWWPEARSDSLGAGLQALSACRAYGRQRALRACRGRPACRRRVEREPGWQRALAHYHGGLVPSWGYASRAWAVVLAARRVREKARFPPK